MTISFEILTSPEFDNLLSITTNVIEHIYDLGSVQYAFQDSAIYRPAISSPQQQSTGSSSYSGFTSPQGQYFYTSFAHSAQSSGFTSATGFQQSANMSLTTSYNLADTITKLLTQPILLPSQPRVPLAPPVTVQQPSSLLTIEYILREPSLLTDRKYASRYQLEAWASATILAYLRGKKAFNLSIQLVLKTDKLPLTDLHLQRCTRMVRLERKWAGIPQIDAQNGKVRHKSANVMGKLGGQKQMTREKETQLLAEYRTILKNVLRDFNIYFYMQFNREPSKDDKEILRPLYMEYKALKQYVADELDTKQLNVEDPIIRPLLLQLIYVKQQATQMLQKVVPRDYAGIKLFKREIYRCLFYFKEIYDKALSAVSNYKKENNRIPGGLQENWAQGFIEIYNLLFSAYEKLKTQVK